MVYNVQIIYILKYISYVFPLNIFGPLPVISAGSVPVGIARLFPGKLTLPVIIQP